MIDFPLKNLYKFRVRITSTKYLVLSIISALILRLYLLYTSLNPINSDEAIIGLMARHILKGEHPTFFYGQNYYGPLESYFATPLFAIFGSNRIILKIVPLVSSLLFIYAIYWLGKTLYSESIGLYSAVYAALPPAMLTVRQLQADAAYPLVLLIGTFSLLIFSRLQTRFSWIRLGILICLFALGFWLHPIMGYYLASTGLIYLFYKLNISRHKLAASSRIILIFSLVLAGTASLFFWGGIDLLTRIGNYLVSIIIIALPVVFGIFKPYDQFNKFAIERADNGPLLNGLGIAIALILAIFILKAGLKNFKRKNILLFTFVIVTALIYSEFVIFLQVDIDTLAYPRYLSTIYSAIPLGVFGLFRYSKGFKNIRPIILSIFLVINVFGNLTLNSSQPPYLLCNWLVEREGIQYVYTDYWTGYWLAFESKEKVIPYILNEQNEPGFNRYLPYRQEVESAVNPVYIFKTGEGGERKFKQTLIADKIPYQSIQIQGYDLYFDLSQPVVFSNEGYR